MDKSDFFVYNSRKGCVKMLRILVCDDDKYITDKVEGLLRDFEKTGNIRFEISVHNDCGFILEDDNVYDIAVVDIQMPGISGLLVSEKLMEKNNDILIIVLTSFQNYLDDAMKIHVFRYLSKPLDENRFIRNLKDAVHEYSKKDKTVTISDENGVHIIRTKDILMVETLKHGSKITTVRGTFRSPFKPKDLLPLLGGFFAFSHNSVLVNLQNVIDFNKITVVLRKSETETVETYMSQRKYPEFKKEFYSFVGGVK